MEAPAPHSPSPPDDGARLFAAHLQPRRRAGRRLARWLGIPLGVLALGAVGLHVALNSDAVRQEVIHRIHERLPESVGHFEIGDTYEVDWLGRLRLGPVKVSSGPGAPPWLTLDELRVRPSYGALLRGKARPARVTLLRVRIDADTPRDELRRLLQRLRERPAAPRPTSGSDDDASALALLVEDAELGRAEASGWKSLFGPVAADVRLLHDAQGRRVKGHAALPGGARARLEAVLPSGGAATLELWAEALELTELPDFVTARLPLRIEKGELDGHARFQAPADLKSGKVEGSLALRALSVSGERLAPEPVGPLDVIADVRARWEREPRKLSVERVKLSIGRGTPLEVEGDGELQLSGERPFRVDVRTLPMTYPKLLAALPPQLVPGPEVPRPDGALGATAHLAGELRKPEEWKVEVKLDVSGLKKAAKAEPIFLAGPFEYQPQESVGPPRRFWVDETNPDFVPFAELPAYVYRAVTASEDAGFFAHQGFDFVEMKDSLVEAAEQKRFRGASTITQQLSKNLFLSRERTYARKVREALVTVLLEAALPKPRLLEIYLNIIEWGPGLYGLGEAARYYFGVDPRQLSVKQAAYLATIIPSPVRTHVFFEKGAINEIWEKRIQDLLAHLRDEQVISESDFEAALAEPLVFRPKEAAGAPDGAPGIGPGAP